MIPDTLRFSLILLLVSISVFAQSPADSLQCLLDRKDLADTTRVDILNKLAWNLKHKSPEESIQYAGEALVLSQQAEYTKGQGEAYNQLGIGHTIIGDYSRAAENFMKALSIWDSSGALLLKANTVNNIGNVYQLQGDLLKATSFFRRALSIRKKLNDTTAVYASYTSIALVYKERQLFDTALYFFKEFLVLAYHQQDKKRISAACNNIGMVFRNMKQYDSALVYFQNALILKEKLNDEQGKALSYRNLGDVFQLQGHTDIALKYYRKAVAIRERIGYNLGLTILLKDMAYLFLERGDLAQAKIHAQRSVSVARESKMKAEEAEAIKVLSAVWEAQKEYSKALQTFRMHVSLKDSLFNEEKMKQVNDLQFKYENEQKEKALLAKTKSIEMLELTQQHDEKIKIALWVASIMLVVLVLVVFSRYQLKKRAEKEAVEKNSVIEDKNRKIEAMNAELEKRMLRAQMDPHFIFNSLNSIQHFITINDKRSTLKYLSKFSKLIRQVLESSVNTIVTLEDEIRLLQNYIELEALRLNNKFQYHFFIDPSLDVGYIEVPFLLLQPYVENAIQHGLRNKEKDGTLHIRFMDLGDSVCCEIEDNGIGRVASGALRKEDHQSYGMSVTSQRLERLNLNNPEKTHITIEDLYDEWNQPAGTKVMLLIPKQYENDTVTIASLENSYRG
jgi:tetratricopeptide (TPR) repeat protein